MPLVHLKTRRLEYKFEIHDKFNIIKGDSGTGKTLLYDVVMELSHQNVVRNYGDTNIVAVPMNFEAFPIEEYNNTILIIDEYNTLFQREDVASILMKSNNYFLLITRTMTLGYLPINVWSIFEIVNSEKIHTLKELYVKGSLSKIKNVDTIIIEDKKSLHKFLEDFLTKFNEEHLIGPAYGDSVDRKEWLYAGKAKIVSTVEYKIRNGAKGIVIIYDATTFGIYYDKLLETVELHKDINIYPIDWESFERYILNSALTVPKMVSRST